MQSISVRFLPILFVMLGLGGLLLTGCDSNPVDADQDQPKPKAYPDDYTSPSAGAKNAPQAAPPSQTEPPEKVSICHQPGTPAEKTLTLPVPAAKGHVQSHGDFYGTCDARIIDADGEESPDRGLPESIDDGLAVGANLTSWPTGFYQEGLDWFDTDGTCTWTRGDDLHVEGERYEDAQRDGVHDDNDKAQDPVVLDLNGSLTDGDQVDVDLESGTTFTGCDGPDPLLKFFDKNGNGFWDNGEDIVLDEDDDGVFN